MLIYDPNRVKIGLSEKCEQIAELGIDEACEILLQEGGIDHVLKYLACLVHGEVAPVAVIARLQEKAARILSA